MARMGGKKHLKTFASPDFWPIPVKERRWTVRPSPGPHSIEMSVPLSIIVRDMLGYATSLREARKLISSRLIEVDGIPRTDYKFPIGVMDVIHILPEEKYYRIVPDTTKFFKLVEIDEEEARIKPLRIEDKNTVKGGHIQLHLHDGRNLLIRVSDPRNPEEDIYKTLGTLVISLPGQEIVEYLPLEINAYAVIIGGRNVGKKGRIVEIKRGMRRYRSLVTLRAEDSSIVQTSLDYILVVGKDKPIIKL
jgi:small subunit ribosomal protein S4e